MAWLNKYPYTNFHEMNLDWILQELKELINEWAEFENTYKGITAEAETVPYGDGASVTITGGDGTPFNFDFKIPAGKDLKVLSTQVMYGISESSNVQPETWTSSVPVIPQAYFLWTRVILNFNDGTSSTFYSISRNGLDGSGSVVSVNNISPDGQGNVNIPIPQPSDDTPQSDTQYGYEGISNLYSRSDHRHVADSNKVDKLSNENIGDESAYIIQDTTTQTKRGISSNPVTNNIVKYNANGNFVVNEPRNANEVMRKVDVEDNYPSNNELATILADYIKNTDIATLNKLGIVKPDGITTNINLNGELSTILQGMSLTLLWTNASPSSTFNAQTINIDLTDYKFIYILSADFTGTGGDYSITGSSFIMKGDNGRLWAVGDNVIRCRRFITTNIGVEFLNAIYQTAYNTWANSGISCVPLYIYGIK